MVKKKYTKLSLGNIIILFIAVALFFSLFYMASYLRDKEEEIRSENPIVFCRSGKCFFTTHVHYFVVLKKAGAEQSLRFEFGPLDSFHTHYERNKIHWHGLIEINENTNEANMPKLEKLLYDMNIKFDNARVLFDGNEVNPREFELDLRMHDHKNIEIIEVIA